MTTVKSIQDIILRRELKPGDLGYIAYLHARLYAEELGYGPNFERYVLKGILELAQQYDPSKDRVWIYEHEGKTVGCLVGFHRDEDCVQFRYFIFLPEYRGMGLGKRLMDEFIAYMKEKNYTRAYLWTTHEQQAAIALYTRYGFTLTEEKSSDTFDKHLVERRYDLVLSN